MTQEEIAEMRQKMMERMKNVDKTKMMERMAKMQEMMKRMPMEMNAVMRVQMLVREVDWSDSVDGRVGADSGLFGVRAHPGDDDEGGGVGVVHCPHL